MLESKNGPYRSPQSLNATSVSRMIYVADVDQTFSQALSAGSKQTRAVEDQFYGGGSGNLTLAKSA